MKKTTIAIFAVISMFTFGCKKNTTEELSKPATTSHASFANDPIDAGIIHNELLTEYLNSADIDSPTFSSQDVLETLNDVLTIAAEKGYIDPSDIDDYSIEMFDGMMELGYFDNDGILKSEDQLNAIYPSLAEGPFADAVNENNNSIQVGSEFVSEITQRIIDLDLDPETEEATIAEGYLSIADSSAALAIRNLSTMSATVQQVDAALKRITLADSNGFDEGWEAARIRDKDWSARVIWGATYAVVRSAEQTKRELARLR